MTLHLSISADAEARLRKLAAQTGKDLDVVASELLETAASAQSPTSNQSAADFEKALDELFAADTRELPATSSTYSRDEIYSDHD